MSAGTGVAHSEFNPSPDEPVHLLQIWILPAARNLPPSYEQKFFSDEERTGRLRLIASPDGSDGSVQLHQDSRVYAGIIAAGQTLTHDLKADRYGWIQIARGSVTLNDLELSQGDGAAISQESKLKIATPDRAEVLLFDLA
jgi:quercetin 2,3-dioxygenase